MGDATTAAALLRPDYKTGPSLRECTALVECLGSCLDQGILVRRVDAFGQVADADLILLDRDMSVDEQMVQARCGLTVERLSTAVGSRTADSSAFEGIANNQSDESKAQRITALRASGRKIVYIGNCRENPLSATAANISLFPISGESRHPADDDIDPSGIWLQHLDVETIVTLRQMAASLKQQSQSSNLLILIPNLTCIAGAFLLGFTSLAVVALSNLGTFILYVRSHRTLVRAERRLRNRPRLLAPVHAPGQHANAEPPEPEILPQRRAAMVERVQGSTDSFETPFLLETSQATSTSDIENTALVVL
jgi:hypothetical protein